MITTVLIQLLQGSPPGRSCNCSLCRLCLQNRDFLHSILRQAKDFIKKDLRPKAVFAAMFSWSNGEYCRYC